MTDKQKLIIQDKANLVAKAGGREVGYLQAFNPQETVLANQPKFTVDRNCKRSEIDSELYIRQIAPYMPAFSWVDGKPTIDTQLASTNQYLFPFAAENSYSYKSGLSVELDASTAGQELIGDNTFTSSTNWSINGNVSIGTGAVITADGTTDNYLINSLDNLFSFVGGKSYKFTYIISDNTLVGTGTIAIGSVSGNELVSTTNLPNLSAGTHTIYLQCQTTATANRLSLRTNNSLTSGSITFSSISVKEVSAFNSPFKDSTGNVVKCGRKLVEDTSNDQHYLQKIYYDSGLGTVTFTAIVKQNNRDFIVLSTYEDGTGLNSQIYFDIKNGVVGTMSGAIATGIIKKRADGYYKCSLTRTQDASSTAFRVYVKISDQDYGASSPSYQGDGTSGVYIAGIQFEKGKPTAFINDPADAEGSTAGRLGDILDPVSISADPTVGVTLFFEGKGYVSGGNNFGVYNADKSSSFVFYFGNSQYKATLYCQQGGTELVRLDSITNDANTTIHKYAIRLKGNYVDLWADGVKENSATLSVNFTDLFTQYIIGGNWKYYYGKIVSDIIIPYYLTDSEVQTLTS